MLDYFRLVMCALLCRVCRRYWKRLADWKNRRKAAPAGRNKSGPLSLNSSNIRRDLYRWIVMWSPWSLDHDPLIEITWTESGLL